MAHIGCEKVRNFNKPAGMLQYLQNKDRRNYKFHKIQNHLQGILTSSYNGVFCNHNALPSNTFHTYKYTVYNNITINAV
ncbi:hypothetical protein SDC9_189007 [bioreactor metagenome]|uniref:Uncharacterized protein n=1 Tax=bioreactor metagenome TaxID=1076179 RepID=A0A645HQX4_9ZZZZ